SGRGNIGTNRGTNAISTTLDASNYTTYGPSIIGANRYNGTITGNIENTVIGGTTAAQGGIGNFDGGSGTEADRLSKAALGASNEGIYDAYTSEQRAKLAFDSATYKILGNIHSHLVKGSFGNAD
ncbi:hypothetical protein DRJ84_14730, partial [Enterococcus faecalis]